MSATKKICVITGSRAEYGLLRNLMREIQQASEYELQVLVTGMHLSEKYGETWQEISADGFEISAKVEMLEADNSNLGVAQSTGRGVIGSANELSKLQPNLLVVLGDRFESFAAATAATFLQIPIAHFHGGETTEGAFDESMRHAITKMSHLHFTATEPYRKRVIQLGEHPNRVFNIGAVGLDNMGAQKQLLNRHELQDQLNFEFRDQNMLVTFHPVTLEQNSAESQFLNLLNAIEQFTDCGVIFTNPNADPGSESIAQLIEPFVEKYSERMASFVSLGFQRYLSTLQYVDVVVGNSSSGLIEVPYFKTPTVNIGDRQKGRIAGPTVINCQPSQQEIQKAIEIAFSPDFRASIKDAVNPYGEPGASHRAIEIIKSFDLNGILKKQFFDFT